MPLRLPASLLPEHRLALRLLGGLPKCHIPHPLYGQVYCQQAGCPTSDYARCDHYCYHTALSNIATLSEEDCSAFLAIFSCLPDCFPDPPASPAAAATATGARRSIRP